MNLSSRLYNYIIMSFLPALLYVKGKYAEGTGNDAPGGCKREINVIDIYIFS